MNVRPPRILISAPLLGLPEQVGLLRVQRTLRWLHGAGVETVVVAAGEPERTEPREMGCDVWIRSPAELLLSGTHPRAPHPRLAALRRRWRELRHLPDPGAKWAARAATHPLVLEQIGDVQWAWSSSPPESAHLLAYHLRTAHPLRHVVDLRDGWIDEPLKPALQKYRWRRALEERVERRILNHSHAVVVSSEVWRRKLLARLGPLPCPVHVLTNAMPQLGPPSPPDPSVRPLRLVHAGSFTLSSNRRHLGLLLEPLLDAASSTASQVSIDLIGRLQPSEQEAVLGYAASFDERAWALRSRSSLPRPALWTELREAHGLLLLSASDGAIPAKLFEYLALGRPILAICPRGSAVWELAAELPQLHCVEMEAAGEAVHEGILGFLSDCQSRREPYAPPPEYSEAILGRRFLQEVLGLPSSGD